MDFSENKKLKELRLEVSFDFFFEDGIDWPLNLILPNEKVKVTTEFKFESTTTKKIQIELMDVFKHAILPVECAAANADIKAEI